MNNLAWFASVAVNLRDHTRRSPFRQSSVGERAVFCTFFLIGVTVIPYGNYGLRACRSFSKVSNSEQKGTIVSKSVQ